MFTLESVYWFLKSAGFVRPTVNKVELDLFINPSRKIALKLLNYHYAIFFFISVKHYSCIENKLKQPLEVNIWLGTPKT